MCFNTTKKEKVGNKKNPWLCVRARDAPVCALAPDTELTFPSCL